MPRSHLPRGPVGVGLGLRWAYLDELLARGVGDVPVDFFEVSPENYMTRGGRYPAALERVLAHRPILTHGLTMSFGAVDDPPEDYLAAVDTELRRVGTPWHSDHLCFSTSGPRVLHDLLPIKMSAASVRRVADRVRRVRDRLRLPLAVENISWYAQPGRAEMPEAEFLARVLEEADCLLLLDVNNVYVNAVNHGFDARAFLDELPLDRVVQLHVAGHTHTAAGFIIDTHGEDMVDPVLELVTHVVAKTGPVPVLLERDNDIPPLDGLLAEVGRVRAAYDAGLARGGGRHAAPPAEVAADG